MLTFLERGTRDLPHAFTPEVFYEHFRIKVTDLMEWLPVEGRGGVHVTTNPHKPSDVPGEKTTL